MKQKLFTAGVLFLLFFLLRHPQEALAASREGMRLWLYTLLPTLLPFLILTNFLVHTNGIEKILSPFKGIWRVCFGLSPAGAYVFLLGMLCGYPMGAKLASDLYQYEKISKREAEYLLTFCNNPSPAFVTTYLAYICLENRVPIGSILGILVFSNFLCMLFFRFLVFKNRTVLPLKKGNSKKETSIFSSRGALIDASIMNGFETITRLGGYILMFSILSACVGCYWTATPALLDLAAGILELTTGLSRLMTSELTFSFRFLLSMTMTSFGGLCIMAQTKSVLNKKLSLLPYIFAKCLNAAFTAAFVLILI